MNAPEKFLLPDTQSLPDLRRMAIQKVGVKGLRYPVAVVGSAGIAQHVQATFDMYVGLPPDVKGTHMSRFVEVLEAQHAPLDLDGFRALLDEMLVRLDADTGHLEMRFPTSSARRRRSPASRACSTTTPPGPCRAPRRTGRASTVALTAPVTSLCPCSKKISDYGAHNQRSHITMRADVVVGPSRPRSWCASPRTRLPARFSAC